jgi:intein/homing endonuclease
VVGETLIKTPNGVKKISEVSVGDQLLTAENDNFIDTKVTKTMNRVVDELYEIELGNGSELKITGEHPVMTRRGWVEAKNLVEDDEVLTC